MGLINPKNVVTPITNKVNLVTIILLTALFVVLRLSGGAVSVATRGERRQPMRVTESDYHVNDDYMASPDPILKDEPVEPEPIKKVVPSKPVKRSSGALDDIEKTLGLR